AVVLDPSFALAYAACANACAMYYSIFSRDEVWIERAREASGKAVALRWDLPEVQVSQAWVLYAAGLYDEGVRMVKKAIERKRDCEGAYYLLFRALFAAGRYQEVMDVAESAIDASGEDYNVYVPILNSVGAMGKEGAKLNITRRFSVALENHLKHVPEDARARVLLGANYARLEREEDALRELNLAVTLRANESSILYNAACVYCGLNRKAEALETLRKAWEAGSRDSVWTRRDPDLTPLHGPLPSPASSNGSVQRLSDNCSKQDVSPSKLRWSYDNVAKGNLPFFAALKIDGPRQFFVAIECAAGDAGNFLIVNHGLAVLDDGDHSADQRDVKRLPRAALARELRRWRQETVDASGVMAGRLRHRVGFDLHFVAPAQIDAAVGHGAAVEFHVQLEIVVLPVVDQFRAIAGRNQFSIFDFPDGF